VVRNRVKRLLREAFRLEQHAIPMGFDLLLVARAGVTAPLMDLRHSIREIIPKAVARAKQQGAPWNT
jgi:ribonuclease P protein component